MILCNLSNYLQWKWYKFTFGNTSCKSVVKCQPIFWKKSTSLIFNVSKLALLIGTEPSFDENKTDFTEIHGWFY